MKNNIIKAFSLGLITGAMVSAGIANATVAAAEGLSADGIEYAHRFEMAICGALLANPTNGGVIRVLQLVQNDGWSAYDSGYIVSVAVDNACPAEWDVLRRFVNLAQGESGSTV